MKGVQANLQLAAEMLMDIHSENRTVGENKQ